MSMFKRASVLYFSPSQYFSCLDMCNVGLTLANQAAVTKHWVTYITQNFISHSSGGRKSKVREPTWLGDPLVVADC